MSNFFCFLISSNWEKTLKNELNRNEMKRGGTHWHIIIDTNTRFCFYFYLSHTQTREKEISFKQTSKTRKIITNQKKWLGYHRFKWEKKNSCKIQLRSGKKEEKNNIYGRYLLFKLFICISFSNDDNSGDQCLYIIRMLLLLFNEDDDNHYDYQKHFFVLFQKGTWMWIY